MNPWSTILPVLFACILLLPVTAPGREIIDTPEYLIQTIGIEDGLPHQLAHRLVQDKTGFLWISTAGGLMRYDGNRLQPFTSPLLTTRNSDNICAIALGPDGNLWAAPNHGGLASYDPAAREFREHPGARDFPAGLASFLTRTPDGAIWAGYFTAQLLRWHNGRSTWFTNGLALQQTMSLAVDGSGKVWVASDSLLASYENGRLVPHPEPVGSRLCIGSGLEGAVWVASSDRLYRLLNGKLEKFDENPPWAPAGRVSAVLQESNGTLWVGTKGQGLFRIQDDKFRRIPTSHPWITHLTADNEGNVWASTRGGGVNRIRKKPFHFWQSRSDLLASGITSVCEDSADNIWVASNGGGLIMFNRGRMHRHQDFRDELLNGVQVICPDQLGHLWIGTRTALLRWNRSPSTRPEVILAAGTNQVIHALFCRSNGEMWAGGENGFIGRYRNGRWELLRKPEAGGAVVRAIGEDSDQNVWVALNNGGLLQFTGDCTSATNFATPEASMVRCMHADSGGGLWMATTRDGLLLRQDGKFHRVLPEQGLPAETVDGMLEDDGGFIWFGTRAGLYYVPAEQLRRCALGEIPRVEPIPFGRSAGLVGYSLNGGFQPTLWKARSGQFWMATHRGLIGVQPERSGAVTHRSPVLIDAISLDDRPVPVAGSLTIPSKVRKLEFRLAVIDFSAPDMMRIRHRLEGFDSDWVEAGNERSFAYPRLSPGKYRLFVRACNSDGAWSESASPLLLSVTPAWWQYRSLQLGAVVMALALVIVSVRTWSHRRLQLRLERLEQKQAMEKERARIAKNLHDDLGASLTEIGLLAELAGRNGKAGGNGVIAETAGDVNRFFSERVRGLARTLDTIVWTVNPRNDSLSELATYLCECSQELFGLTSIRCRLDVSGEIPRLPLSPEERSNLFLTAREAMNNVIKHSGGTECRLAIRMEGNLFRIRIEDNGRGFDPLATENRKRNGLANMRSRIQELNGSFSIASAPGRGTVIDIAIAVSGLESAGAGGPGAVPGAH